MSNYFEELQLNINIHFIYLLEFTPFRYQINDFKPLIYGHARIHLYYIPKITVLALACPHIMQANEQLHTLEDVKYIFRCDKIYFQNKLKQTQTVLNI